MRVSVCVCMFMYIINNSKGVGVARQETTTPTLPPQDFRVLGHSAKMRALSRVFVAVCAILTLSFCDASSVTLRAKRGVVPGNAASRPKG